MSKYEPMGTIKFSPTAVTDKEEIHEIHKRSENSGGKARYLLFENLTQVSAVNNIVGFRAIALIDGVSDILTSLGVDTVCVDFTAKYKMIVHVNNGTEFSKCELECSNFDATEPYSMLVAPCACGNLTKVRFMPEYSGCLSFISSVASDTNTYTVTCYLEEL